MPTVHIQFEIAIKSVHAHIYSVICTIHNSDCEALTFSLPAWTPGSYLIRDFAQHVLSISAFSGTTELELTQISKDTWRCPSSKELRIVYEIYAFDSSIRAAFIDDSYAFFSGTSVFVRVHGLEHVPHSLHISKPPLDNFRIATSMPKQCQDYDELVDHPVLMGDFSSDTFEAGGVTHHLVMTPQHAFDSARMLSDCQRICQEHIDFFGTPAPFKNYHFLLRVEEEGYGGLEHRASSALLCKTADLPQKHQTKMSDGYRTLLGLVSHEYFHAWNVKRLKPASFVSYDYNSENYTELLWFFEGFTSYYDDLALCRSGVIDLDAYLELVSKTLTRVQGASGRFKQSLAEASFNAWIKFYKPNENSSNATVSYYQKGSLIALALDLTIRELTQNKSSLDDVMRALWHRFLQNGTGVTQGMIVEAASVAAGTNMRAFFDTYVHSTADFVFLQLLENFGIMQECQPPSLYLGCQVKREGDACKVVQVDENSPAMQAGICAGDTLIALNKQRIAGGNLEAHLTRYVAGESLTLHAFRRGTLRDFSVTLAEKASATYKFKNTKELTPSQSEALRAWLAPTLALSAQRPS